MYRIENLCIGMKMRRWGFSRLFSLFKRMPRAHTLRSLVLSLLALGHNWQRSSIQAGFIVLPPNCPGSEMDIFYIHNTFICTWRQMYWNECRHLHFLAHYTARLGIRLKRLTRKLNRMRPKGQRKGTLY